MTVFTQNLNRLSYSHLEKHMDEYMSHLDYVDANDLTFVNYFSQGVQQRIGTACHLFFFMRLKIVNHVVFGRTAFLIGASS